MKLLSLRRRRRQRAGLRALPRLNVEAEVLDAPEPDPSDDDGPWWGTAYGRWRLSAEVSAMRRFPGFRAHVRDDEIWWTGRLRSALGGRSYLVRVTYPYDFPDDAPNVMILSPELPEGVPHVLSPQRPCLFRGGPRDGYDPGSTTAATLVAWTALWIHAFETWQSTGVWPGAGD